MKKLIIASAILVSTCSLGFAAEFKLGALTISDPFARATAGQATAGGGFFTVMNDGAEDRLIAAHADVAATTELHTHIHEGDVMKMRQVDAIDVPANGSVELKPGGYHVMLMGLKAPLKQGETFPLHLTFEKAGELTIDVEVGGVGAKMAPTMDHSKMKMDKQ
ncbi:copper chaperone PCu(A)C [uncultured Cohaesibacter sp.]|uniref:copper chaperone PCu(A)C n=1 Tax=uncultured Cohaesibacter sp. TaxID=1002546 RepID=UPI0029C6BF13|nr:copper chaperone PCu(A)C [uncultured Cohaesibacter sp.]